MRLLLDTHAMIWLDAGEPMNREALDLIDAAGRSGELFVSAISFWELAQLVARGRVRVQDSIEVWIERFSAQPGITAVPLTPAAAVRSVSLPGLLHRDPADRFLIATALELDAAIVTRDQVILAHAQAGHVDAIPC